MHSSRMRTARTLPCRGGGLYQVGVSVCGGLCPGGLYPGGLCSGGLCPGGLCLGSLSGGSLSRVSLSREFLSRGVSLRGVSVQGVYLRETPVDRRTPVKTLTELHAPFLFQDNVFVYVP